MSSPTLPEKSTFDFTTVLKSCWFSVYSAVARKWTTTDPFVMLLLFYYLHRFMCFYSKLHFTKSNISTEITEFFHSPSILYWIHFMSLEGCQRVCQQIFFSKYIKAETRVFLLADLNSWHKWPVWGRAGSALWLWLASAGPWWKNKWASGESSIVAWDFCRSCWGTLTPSCPLLDLLSVHCISSGAV